MKKLSKEYQNKLILEALDLGVDITQHMNMRANNSFNYEVLNNFDPEDLDLTNPMIYENNNLVVNRNPQMTFDIDYYDSSTKFNDSYHFTDLSEDELFKELFKIVKDKSRETEG